MHVRTPFRRGLGLAALALAATAAGARAQQPQLPPAAQITARYLQAVGGQAAVERHAQRRTVTETNFPGMGITMTGEMYQARPDKMVMKVNMGAMGTSSGGYDGTVAWAVDAMQGPRVLQGAEAAETMRQADFSMDLAQSFRTMETAGEKTVGGKPCWDVRMVHRTGIVVNNCFDKESGLLVQTAYTQASPMGQMPVVATISEYRDFDGVKLPSRISVTLMGQEMVTTVKSVSHEPFDPAVFAIPAEIKALRPGN